MKYLYLTLVVLSTACSQQSLQLNVAVTSSLNDAAISSYQEGTLEKEKTVSHEKPTAREWFDFADHLSKVHCEYDVEIRWAPFQIPEKREVVKGAAKELETVLLGEGDTEPVFDSLAKSVEAFWKVRPDDAKYATPGKYRITRGNSKVLQYCLIYPTVHNLRTPELAISYAFPPGQIVVEKRKDTVALYEPHTLLHPLPYGKGLAGTKKLEWSRLGERLFRSKESEIVQSTVLLDEKNRPVAFWVRLSKTPHVVSAGFYEWFENEDGEDFPSRAITLRGQIGGIHATMYNVKLLSLDDPKTEPLLVVKDVSRVIDRRGAKARTIPQPLPAFLEKLILIDKD